MYLYDSITSTNPIICSLDDLFKVRWSKCNGIKHIRHVLNSVPKFVEYNVFDARIIRLKNHYLVPVGI